MRCALSSRSLEPHVSVSVIERLAINIPSVVGQMGPDGRRQIDIRRIWHFASPFTSIFAIMIGREIKALMQIKTGRGSLWSKSI